MSPAERWVERVLTARWWLLVAAIVLAALALEPAGRLHFDRSVENMFAPNDPLLAPFRRLKEAFSGNELALVAYEDESLLAADGRGLERLRAAGERARAVPGVRDVFSLADLDRLLRQLGGAGILDRQDRLATRYRELFAGYTHSADGRVAALVCQLAQETTVPRRETVAELARIAETLGGTLAGEPVMIVDGFRLVEADGRRLGWATTLLLGLVILLCFRSLRWVLIPIAVVQWSLLLTRATLVWLELRLSMVSSMLTAIVTVVGIATLVHIIVRFREFRGTGLAPGPALGRTLLQLAAPVAWSFATDAAGFGSLLLSHVGPVADFGLMTAVGALLVMAAVVLLVPGLALAGSFDTDPRRTWGEGRLDGLLARLTDLTRDRPKTLAAVSFLIVVALAVGAMRLEIETDFTRNFRAGSTIVRSYDFIETRLGGAGVWDVLVPAPDGLTPDFLARVARLEARLRALESPNGPALTKVLSLVDALEAADAHPALGLVPLALRAQGLQTAQPSFVAPLFAPGRDGRPGLLRIMLRAPERQPAAEKLALIRRVRELAAAEFPEAETTGFFVLLSQLITSLLRDQWTCFLVATAMIGVMMAVAFRSPRLAAIALVPNAVPILMVMGAMGWLGTPVNMGAAMISAVSMGLSIDSSIHYITSFLRARRAGRTATDALAEVQQSVGRAATLSTVALIVGFSVLCGSEFVPTIYFGVLVSLTMFGGLLGNLLILPVLLLLFAPTRMANRNGMIRGPKSGETPLESSASATA